MNIGQLPLNTWLVIERPKTNGFVLASEHATQQEAEAERDGRNAEARFMRFTTCLIIEPVAQRMGGHPHWSCTERVTAQRRGVASGTDDSSNTW